MPDPTPPSRCTFTGTAQAIHLLGNGAAVLADRAPFSSGHSTSVELFGASVGASPSPVLERPADLDPVNMNADGAPYDVTYSAGPPITVQVAKGGAIGHFQGHLATAPTCASPPGCDITWSGARTVVLHRADATPMDLTGAFPFGDPEPLAPKQPAVQEITLHGARGTLTCPDGARPLAGDFTWIDGPHHMLTVEPLRLEAAGLGVTVTNEAAPAPLGFSRTAVAGLAAGAVALLGGLVVAIVVRKRRRPRRAPLVSGGALAPIEVVCLSSPKDADLAAQVDDQLVVLERRDAIRVFSPRRVSPGKPWDLDARLRRARLILLLVSADFLASNLCWEEMEQAMKRHNEGEARVVPVILRACDWKETPFGALSPLPSGGKPVTAWSPVDAALNDVAAGVKAILAELRAQPAKAAALAPPP